MFACASSSKFYIFSLYFVVWGLYPEVPFVIVIVWKAHYGSWRILIFKEEFDF